MFNRIPSDLSEIVVVYTRCVETCLKLKEIVEKFKDNCVEERIFDKLTTKTVDEYGIRYNLSDKLYRSYDRPCYMSIYPLMYDYAYLWSDCNKRCRLFNAPSKIIREGNRHYKNRVIHVSESNPEFCIYAFGDLKIYLSGHRRVLNKSIRYIL